MSTWHTLDTSAVLQQLGTDQARGLRETEASRRLAEVGPNELVEAGLRTPWRILWDQLKETLIIILVAAALISAFLGDYKDTIAILAIVVLDILLGFSQEYRAERATAALKQLTVPAARVRRDGSLREISVRDLVPGDILLLETGNLIPADGRVLESYALRAQEAALTGESDLVTKIADCLAEADLPLGDRRNMVYRGTNAAAGRGLVVVTATGMATELGHIATLLQTVHREPTPLQRRLDRLGKRLAILALALVGVIVLLGVLRGENLPLLLLTAVSIAVAAIPEGLPAMVTIALALGAQRMLRRQALIRKLPAVETLGSVTVICSDKTGTLTQNRMTVTVLDVAGERLDLTEHLRHDEPEVAVGGPRAPVLQGQPALNLLLLGAALCNDASLAPSADEPGIFAAIGDPTEGALVVAAARLGLWKVDLETLLPRIGEAPFDADRKRMSTIHRLMDTTSPLLAGLEEIWRGEVCPDALIFTKGALGSTLPICQAVWTPEGIAPLHARWQERILAAHDDLARQGMRILGVAFRPIASFQAGASSEQLEQNLTFVGLVGMIDPARPEVRDAVQTCRQAGIRTMMITGDHPLTARAIAQELDMDGQVLTGQELARTPAETLSHVVESVPVYARVSPEHKLAIVRALQQQEQIVAMTGDGVNDAPALKQADIGVAMGITGTDVAKEAADMVLLDDNFATIVAAVEEGRVIYTNIRKFIRYLLTTNVAEIGVVLVGPVLGMPLPLLPLQILWMNLVTDGLPALALGVEPAERQTMRRPPHPPGESVFGRGMGWQIAWGGALMTLVVLGIGYWFWAAAVPTWQTMVFTTLTLAQMANVLAIRSESESLFHQGLRSNISLLAAVGLTILLQLALIYLPWLQGIFSTRTLSPGELGISLALSTVIFWAVELEKWVLRRRHKEREQR